MSVDPATAPTLARLRRARGQHEEIVRWLNLLAPALLVVFVVAACLAHPRPGLTGRPLVVSVAAAVFVVAVLGRNATAGHPFSVTHGGFVAALVISSTALVWVQPHGPGVEAMLLAILCVARLLPTRIAVPFIIGAFVVLELAAWIARQGDVAVLAALGALYGMLYLAFRLGEATKRAERLLGELAESQAAQAEAAGLAERQRLAREMHDVLAHSLSGLMLQLEGARMLAARDQSDPRLPEVIDRAHQLGRAGLDEARGAIGMLRDAELPGPERLAGLAEQFERDRQLPCRLTVTGSAYELGSQARVAVYRVAQEALTNVTKHAHPDRVDLQLAFAENGTSLIVEDVGTGPADESSGGGYGLTGMRERAELLGGRLVAGPTPQGFRVELVLPR